MIPIKILAFHARTPHSPLKGVTSSRLSAWRMTPGGRPVTSRTATVELDSSPRRSCMKGLFPAFKSLDFKILNGHTYPAFILPFFFLAYYRRVALQRPKALFQPQRVKPPGDVPLWPINSPHVKSIKRFLLSY